VTEGESALARFWRLPTLPAQEDVGSSDFVRSVWSPSGDAIAAATPDAARIIFGDQSGNVHIVAAGSGRDGLLATAQELSFYGHSTEVRRLTISDDSKLAASVAADNTLRVWSVEDGLPRSFIAEITGGPVAQMRFEPGGERIGILTAFGVQIISATSGAVIAKFDLGERHTALTFADNGKLYIGSEAGALSVIAQDATGGWSQQTLWRGEVGIRWLEAAPRSRFLVLVDNANLAQQFNLEEGRIGDAALQLPSDVDEVAFTPGGLRVLFRTVNWVHRSSSSANGLIWLDAILVPKALANSRMVFGDPAVDEAAALGNRFYLPVAADGFPRLAEMSFTASQWPGLFGDKDELLRDWQRKLAFVPPQSPDE